MDGILFMLAEAECTMDTAVQLTGRRAAVNSTTSRSYVIYVEKYLSEIPMCDDSDWCVPRSCHSYKLCTCTRVPRSLLCTSMLCNKHYSCKACISCIVGYSTAWHAWAALSARVGRH